MTTIDSLRPRDLTPDDALGVLNVPDEDVSRLVEFAHAGHSILLWAPLVPTAVQWLETIGGFRAGSRRGA